MQLLIEAGAIQPPKIEPLMQEANEILAMIVASIRTARRKQRGSKPRDPHH